MKKFFYRLFVTAFLVGFELAIYFAIWVAYLRPAQDVYFLHCMPDGSAGNSITCNPFVQAKVGLTAIEVIVATTITLGLLLALSALVQARKLKKSQRTNTHSDTHNEKPATQIEDDTE